MDCSVRYYVYKITCTPNGKVYIGFTSREPGVRWREHVQDSTTRPRNPLHYAIRKYGKRNFTCEVLLWSYNVRFALRQEMLEIEAHKARLAANGYNLSIGGGCPGIGKDHLLYRDDVDWARIASAYKAGAGMKALAHEFGVAHGTIANHFRKAGVSIRKAGAHKGLLDDHIIEIAARYSKGETCQQIAVDYGFNAWVVWNALRRHNKKIRPKGWPRS